MSLTHQSNYLLSEALGNLPLRRITYLPSLHFEGRSMVLILSESNHVPRHINFDVSYLKTGGLEADRKAAVQRKSEASRHLKLESVHEVNKDFGFPRHLPVCLRLEMGNCQQISIIR